MQGGGNMDPYIGNEMAADVRKTHQRFPNSKSQLTVGE